MEHLLSDLLTEYAINDADPTDTVDDSQNKHYETVDTLSLYRFTSHDICNKIKQWVYNDINYKNHLFQTTKILSTHLLSGKVISTQPTNNAKLIVQNYLLTFLTSDTLDIMFDCFDEYKTKYPHRVKRKSAQEIADILFHFPLNNLLQRIMDEKIDGARFIHSLKDRRHDIIQEETGWQDSEVYQIEAILLRHHTFTPAEFKQNMDYVFSHRYNSSLSTDIRHKIQTMTAEFDIEALHFKIKNAQNIETFSDQVMNRIDEWIHHDVIKEDDVSTIYQAIAECFMFNHDLVENDDLSLEERQHFICNNCGNCNINSFMNSRMNIDVAMCCLCGVPYRDSIILKLRNQKTYIMVNDVEKEGSTTQQRRRHDSHCDDIDSLIQTAADHGSFSLSCPNRIDNIHCPSIIRLAKMLIVYKRWIHTVYKKTNGNDNIDKTIQVDVARFVNSDTLRTALTDSAAQIKEIGTADMDALLQLFDDNIDGIQQVETFMGMKRIKFIRFCKKHCNIRPACAVKLHSKTLKSLKQEAQTQQFGEFLTDVDMDAVNRDYYHILKTHINNGNKTSIKNAFRFFENVVHSEDTQDEITDCRSTKRRERRVNVLSSNRLQSDESRRMDDTQSKNIWKLKQFYNQSQLDMIHSFLVHSKWQYFVKRYAHQQNPTATEDEDSYQTQVESMDEEEALQNKGKYMTDSSNADNYGFGIEHCHPHLAPKYCSIHDELVFNTLCPLSETCFQNLLIKAIKLHNVAMTTEFNKELICKYFNLQYNIIRNEPIGLRHIFAIIIYTDISSFCTTYRSTYRTINNETTADPVTRRHRELYHYSRCLFEAIEFFGQYMEPDLKVFHGLNRVMHFSQFTAYFNQPISTTTSLTTAAQFADGKGIILTLSSATEYFNDSTKTPKYLSVSWLSCFPNEDEKLFYGAYVVFQITNIIEAESLKGHCRELLMLNKFQKTVQNQTVHWNLKDTADKKKIDALVILITHFIQQIKAKKDTKQEITGIKKSKYLTKYGQALFNYFCDNPITHWICIRNYKLLPGPLQNVLFYETVAAPSTKKRRQRISFMPLTHLFPNLTEIVLNELDIQQMTADAKEYVNIVLEYIKTSTGQMERVIFKSQQQRDRKENSTLKNLVNKSAAAYGKYHWSVKYEFLMENTHNLTFTNNHAVEFTSVTSVKSDTESKDAEPALEDVSPFVFSLQSQTDASLPSYFMQITFIDEDGFHIEILSDQISGDKRKFFIKEMNCNTLHSSVRRIERRIKIESGQSKGAIEVDIHEDHSENHYLALYDSRKATEPIPNAMQMQLVVLKGVMDEHYTPNCIDISTVLKVKNEKNQFNYKWDIYWLIPPKSFGHISYKIVKENGFEEVIPSLPYSVPFAMTPISFQVITICTIDNYQLESVPSKSVSIGDTRLSPPPFPAPPVSDNSDWKCSVCTYMNSADRAKCTMCGLSKTYTITNTMNPLTQSPLQTINVNKGWQCSKCTYSPNADTATRCEVCGASKKATDEEDEQMFDDTNDPNADTSWMCNVCTLHNDGKSDRCVACNTKRPDPTNETQDYIPNNMEFINSYNPNPLMQSPFNVNAPPYNTNTHLSHGMSAKNVLNIGSNPMAQNFQPMTMPPYQGLTGMEQNYDPYGNMNSLNPPFAPTNVAESTLEDFNRAASDIATYNDNPSSIFMTLKSVTKKLLKEDVRYRTLDTTNPKVTERLTGFEGVLDFLMLLGFESDPMGMKLICTDKPSQAMIKNAMSVLNEYSQRFAVRKHIIPSTHHADALEVGGAMGDAMDDEEQKEDELTLQQIVLWVTSPTIQDVDSWNTLIMTHTLFTDSLSLMKALKQRFFTAVPDHILNITDAEERDTRLREYQNNTQKRMHLKTIKIVRDWMKQYFRQDFERNEALKSELEAWLKELIAFGEMDRNKNCGYVKMLHKAVQNEYTKLQRTDWTAKWKQSLNISALFDDVEVAVDKIDKLIGKISAEELADQLTLMDERLVLMIEPREYIELQWKKADEDAAVAVLLLIQQFNSVVKFATIEILKPKSLRDRSKALKRMIKVCERLHSMKNYNSLRAICSAMTSSPLHRLKQAWQRVPEKYLQLYEGYKMLFSRDANHRNLRTALRQAKGHCIPHIGLLLQDFVFINDVAKPKYEMGSDATKYIDFNKCVRLSDRIKQLKSYQVHRYSTDIKEDKRIQKALLHTFETLKNVTEDDVWDMSTVIKRADEKQAKQMF